MSSTPLPSDRPQRTTAAALAFLLGIFGAHKWYTRRRTAAALHMWPVWLALLWLTVVGMEALTFVLFASDKARGTAIALPCMCICIQLPVPLFMLGAACMQLINLVEAIIYLNITDEEFHQRYVIEQRGLF